MVFAQEFAHARQARIGAALVEGRAGFLGVEAHAAELVDVEGAAETADALLPVDGRAAVLALHGEVADQEQRGEDHQGHQGQQAVADALHVALEAVHTVRDEAVVFHCSFVHHASLFSLSGCRCLR